MSLHEIEEENELEQHVDLIGIFIKYFSFWKWFLLSLSITIGLGYFYLKVTRPVYEVTASVLLKDDKKGSGMAEFDALKEMGVFDVKNNVDNELEVLKTTTLVQQVVNELGLFASYKKVGALKNSILYGDECPIKVWMVTSSLDTISSPIEFEAEVNENGSIQFSGTLNKKDYNVHVKSGDSTILLPFGLLSFKMNNHCVIHDKFSVYITLYKPEQVADNFLKNLTMDLTTKMTSVVSIKLKSGSIKLAKDFICKLIEIYGREDIKDQNLVADNTAQFIDKRLISLANELNDVETDVQNYKQNQGLTDIQSEANLFIEKTGDYEQKRLEVETQLAVLSDIDDYVKRKENKFKLLPANAGIQNSSLSELIKNYNLLILQKSRLSRTASQSNQAMIDLNYQIESTFNTVQMSLANEKRSLQISLKDLVNKDKQNMSRIKSIPRQEREYTKIKRQQSIKEALYLFLLQKKEENFLNMSGVVPKAKIIDKPRCEGNPVSPKGSIIYLISIVFGLLIPIILISIAELFKYQIESKEELEKLSNVPILGEILKHNKVGNVMIQPNNTDTFTEMFRLLRTNLLFLLDEPDKKVITVVSSISGEGKTFIAINLAMSLAILDKKVLVIGLDVRKPRLGEYIGIEDKTGITLFLSGHLEKSDLIRPSGVHPNLSVITAGPVPPNPNELLTKSILDDLIQEYRKIFDYIILDTAPVGLVSDSFSLNRLTDINLYVVRSGYTPKKNIADATILYKQKKLKNMCFILNASDISKKSYQYGYGKKYGYGYSYGYGYGNKGGQTYGYSNDGK
jgi:tyrosine-protein kinase Etk/Wzc